MQNRTGKIGASEVAGLVKAYWPELKQAMLESDKVSSETANYMDNLVDNMGLIKNFRGEILAGTYLETPYSLKKKTSFNEAELSQFQEFIANDAMNRGKECEEATKDNFIHTQTFGTDTKLEIVSEQARAESEIFGQKVIATLDYIVKNQQGTEFILECKTVDLAKYFDDKLGKFRNQYINPETGEFIGIEIPNDYIIQVQWQMELHNIKTFAYIHRLAVKSVKTGRGKTKTIEYEMTDKYMTFKVDYSSEIAEIIKYCIWRFTQDENILNKQQELKTKKDNEIDQFISQIKQEIEIEDDELFQIAAEYEELEELAEKYLEREKKLKSKMEMFANGSGIILTIKSGDKTCKLQGNYTTPKLHDEESIDEAIKKAEEALNEKRKLAIGTPKSEPRFGFKIVESKKLEVEKFKNFATSIGIGTPFTQNEIMTSGQMHDPANAGCYDDAQWR